MGAPEKKPDKFVGEAEDWVYIPRGKAAPGASPFEELEGEAADDEFLRWAEEAEKGL